MRRIALRRLLPIVQLTLAAALVMVGEAQRNVELAEYEARIAWYPYDMPAALEIATGINAPAVVVSLPIVFLIWAFAGEQSWSIYLAGGIAIPFFWYFVGSYLD